MTELVSIIIPTYNRPQRLKRAINSVIKQTYRPLELLVIDDNSSEYYVQNIISEINEPEIEPRCIRHGENQGASAARNTGISAAEGKYVAFLDDDDEWLPEKIQKQVSELKKTNAGIASCWIRRVGPDGEHRASHTPEINGDIINRLLLGNVTGTTSSVTAKTNICRSIGGFDTSFPRWNDWDLVIRAAQHTDVKILPEILVRQYNWNGPQLSDDLDKLLTARDLFIKKHKDLASEYGMKEELVARINWGVGYSAGMSGNYSVARRSLLKAIRAYPYRSEFYLYFLAFSGGRFTLRPAQFVRRKLSRIKQIISFRNLI